MARINPLGQEDGGEAWLPSLKNYLRLQFFQTEIDVNFELYINVIFRDIRSVHPSSGSPNTLYRLDSKIKMFFSNLDSCRYLLVLLYLKTWESMHFHIQKDFKLFRMWKFIVLLPPIKSSNILIIETVMSSNKNMNPNLNSISFPALLYSYKLIQSVSDSFTPLTKKHICIVV